MTVVVLFSTKIKSRVTTKYVAVVSSSSVGSAAAMAWQCHSKTGSRSDTGRFWHINCRAQPQNIYYDSIRFTYNLEVGLHLHIPPRISCFVKIFSFSWKVSGRWRVAVIFTNTEEQAIFGGKTKLEFFAEKIFALKTNSMENFSHKFFRSWPLHCTC